MTTAAELAAALYFSKDSILQWARTSIITPRNPRNTNNMKTKSTTKKIAALLKRGRSITPIQALKTFNCFRLGARIHDLRNAGMRIKTTPHKTPSGKTIAKYSLS